MLQLAKRAFTVGTLVPKFKMYPEAALPKQEMIISEHPKKIIVLQNNKEFQIQPVKGHVLLDAALQQGKALEFKCRKGTCGVCRVKIDNGLACLQPPNKKEEKKLKLGLNEGFRLACQSIIK